MAIESISPYQSSTAAALAYSAGGRATAGQEAAPLQVQKAQQVVQPAVASKASAPVGTTQASNAVSQAAQGEKVTLSNQARMLASQAAEQEARQSGAAGMRGDEAMANPTAGKAISAYSGVSAM